MVAPITNLLKKNNFHWNSKAEATFKELKNFHPMLVCPNFDLPFMIETDACDVGVGAILLQEEHLIAFYSKKLSALRKKVLTYAKEL